MSDYQDSTVRVIWAYHHEDPGESGPKYHDSNRGTRSLRLLNPEKVDVLSPASPYFDLVNQDVSFFFLFFFFTFSAFKQKYWLMKVCKRLLTYIIKFNAMSIERDFLFSSPSS